MVKYQITVLSYDELSDSFACNSHEEGLSNHAFPSVIPAFLMNVIALPVYESMTQDEADDLPFSFIGKSFVVAQLF